MLQREDMLELTRRMTPARSSIDRVAGCYFDEEGYIDGTFNTSFLDLTAAEKTRNLKIAKAVPFGDTNRQTYEVDFPGETRASGDMMRLLDAMKECGLKNDALLETFYEVVGEKVSATIPDSGSSLSSEPDGSHDHESHTADDRRGRLSDQPFSVVLYHGIYDIPRKGTDKAEQWESEEVYEYLICCICPVYGDYEMDEPVCGFLYPSFADRSVDWYHIAVYEREPGVSGRGLIAALG